ncbi:MAG: hypothetical protein LBK07_00740 [Tannerella sp.]|jgi:hypothetical protein|nr:hypothetical protein [Tannerella sp.]
MKKILFIVFVPDGSYAERAKARRDNWIMGICIAAGIILGIVSGIAAKADLVVYLTESLEKGIITKANIGVSIVTLPIFASIGGGILGFITACIIISEDMSDFRIPFICIGIGLITGLITFIVEKVGIWLIIAESLSMSLVGLMFSILVIFIIDMFVR